MASALGSDHVNYLVWRYLQEMGYGQAAVKLQQFWLRDPQSLPFAHHVDRRALIGLVSKGLKYSQIERLHSKSALDDGQSPAEYFFGNETARAPSTNSADHDSVRNESLKPSKARGHSATNGYPPKLHLPPQDREASGVDSDRAHAGRNGAAYGPHDAQESHSPTVYSSAEDAQMTNGMDVDEEPDGGPLEQQRSSTLTDGQSMAIQSEKVEDLSPRTSLLSVAEHDNIMHLRWHPLASILAVGGEALCRLFRSASVSEPMSSQDILESGEPCCVTAMSWSPDGSSLAIATRAESSETTATVSTWSVTGKALDDLTAGQSLVIKLRWNLYGTMLLGITSSGDGQSSLVVWDVAQSHSYPPVPCPKVMTDAVWSGDSSITVCGEGAIGRWDLASDQDITWAPKSNTQLSERQWTHIFCSPSSSSVIVFDEERGFVVLLDSHGSILRFHQAHEDSITGIASGSFFKPSSVIATSSLDGTVKIWTTNDFQPVSTLRFGQDAPPLTLALNAEGSLLAAANHSKVLVWDSSGNRVPIAMWRGELSKFPKSALTNGHSADRDSGIGDDATEDGINDPRVSLDWDSNGGRLAFAVGSQIAIINVGP